MSLSIPDPATQPSLPELRPRGVVDLIDATVRLYRRHFGTLLNVSAVLLLPFTVTYVLGEFHLVLAFQPVLTQGVTPVGFTPALQPTVIGSIGTGLALLYAWIVGPLTQGALAVAISELYLGRTITAREAFRRARPYWGSLFLVSIAFGAVAMIGPLVGMLLGGLVGVPVGIYVSPEAGLLSGMLVGLFALAGGLLLSLVLVIRFFLYDTAMVLEGVRGLDSMQRARELVRGHGWHAFGTMALTALGLYLISLVAAAPLGVVSALLTLNGHTDLYAPLQLVANCVTGALGVLLGPVSMIAHTLLYYDLRIKKEGFDLQQMAEAIGKGTGQEEQAAATAAGEGQEPGNGNDEAGVGV